MVSIVIPVYNVEKYLDRCITSIINQTYKDVEIVLVDDGSKDNSGNICDKYADEYSNIKVFHIPNGGVSNARNTGIKASSGEWITFVDADDYLDKSHIENLYKAIDRNTELVVCDYRIVSDEGVVRNSRILNDSFPVKFSKVDAIEDMGKGTSIWGYVWNKLFITEIITKNNIWFNCDIKVWEDMLFCAEYLACCNNINVVLDSTYNYVVRDGSAVNTRSFELKNTKFSACEKFELLLDRLISQDIVSQDSIFARWVRTVYVETSLDGILNGQFKNGIYDKKLIKKYLEKVDKYSSYTTRKQEIEAISLKICPYLIFLLKFRR